MFTYRVIQLFIACTNVVAAQEDKVDYLATDRLSYLLLLYILLFT